jgi:hypothetical protein
VVDGREEDGRDEIEGAVEPGRRRADAGRYLLAAESLSREGGRVLDGRGLALGRAPITPRGLGAGTAAGGGGTAGAAVGADGVAVGRTDARFDAGAGGEAGAEEGAEEDKAGAEARAF